MLTLKKKSTYGYMKHNTHINFVGCVELTTAFSAFKKKVPSTVTHSVFKVKVATLIFLTPTTKSHLSFSHHPESI